MKEKIEFTPGNDPTGHWVELMGIASPGDRELLRERARRLASEGENSLESGIEGGSYLTFYWSGQLFATPLDRLLAIEEIPARQVISIPTTPPFVRGCLLRRGQIINLLDIRGLLGLPLPGEYPAIQPVLLVGHPALGTVAVVVDRVGEVLGENRVERSGDTAGVWNRLNNTYVSGEGIYKSDGSAGKALPTLLAFVNLTEMLSSPELIVEQ